MKNQEVKVILHGGLHKFINRTRKFSLIIPMNSNILDVCDAMGICKVEAYFFELNGEKVDLNKTVKDGNTLSIYPIFGGG